MILPENVTTGLTLPNLTIVRNIGLVRGITVRSPSFQGGFAFLKGDTRKNYTELSEKSREEALELMLQRAAQLGANAVIGVRYDTNDVSTNITEVLAYGTAVVVQ